MEYGELSGGLRPARRLQWTMDPIVILNGGKSMRQIGQLWPQGEPRP